MLSEMQFKFFVIILVWYFVFGDARKSKSGKHNQTKPSSKYDNPNFIRDRYIDEIWKPLLPERGTNKPFHPAWMDYCDPYHCNDYHKPACGLNRKNMRFQWFQSGCHIILNNMCSTYRGALKYDMVDVKYCTRYVMFLRAGCPTVCPDRLEPICGVSTVDNQILMFVNQCAMERANCEGRNPGEFLEVNMRVCETAIENI